MTITELPLSVRNLTKTFAGKKPFTAVQSISFDLNAGEILGLLGPNGAGKSTTIQMLLAALTPTQGDILYFGTSLAEHRSKVLESVGYVSGYSRLPWNLTVRENLDVQGRLYKLPPHERKAQMDHLMKAFEITDLADKLSRKLSAGQVTRVMLARAFMGKPRVVLLDEPTASLDPDIAMQVRAFVMAQRRELGVSMLYTSHNMVEVAEICDRVMFLKKGRIEAIDTPEQLAQKAARSTLRLKLEQLSGFDMHGMASDFGDCTAADGWFELLMDHREIPRVLSILHTHGVALHEIEIEKPTLEDFFLKLSAKEEINEQH